MGLSQGERLLVGSGGLFASAGVASAPLVWTPPSAGVPLRAWYRADLGVTLSAGLVSGWADQSGSGDANRDQVQPVVGFQPTPIASNAGYGGRASVHLGGQFLQSVGAWSDAPVAPMTIVIVGDCNTTRSFISNSSLAAPYNLAWSSSPGLEFFGDGGAVVLDGTTLVNVPNVLMISDDGLGVAGSVRIFAGNDLTTPQATAAGPAITAGTGFDLGRGSAGVADMLGDLAEVIIWGGVLNAGDLAELKAYLNTTQAYGLGVT